MVPALGGSTPRSARISVDFPDPLGPMTVAISPRPMVRSTWESAGVLV